MNSPPPNLTQEEYEAWLENQPPEALFDYRTIQSACIEAFPKHEASEMMFDEYKKRRNSFIDHDPDEKKQITFYMPSEHADLATSLALVLETPSYHCIVLLIEMGLIHFQNDYHEEYSVIRSGIKDSTLMITAETARAFHRVKRNGVVLCSGSNCVDRRKFTPSIPMWLYNAISEISNYLYMSKSDLIYACWCIAVRDCLENSQTSLYIDGEVRKVCTKFDYEVQEYYNAIVRMMDIVQPYQGQVSSQVSSQVIQVPSTSTKVPSTK